MVQLSHLYMTTGKTTAFTIWIFVGKVMLMARLFSMLFSFPSKEQASFNWWMAAFIVQSGSGAQEKKICHCFCFSPIYFPWSDGTGCHDLSFLNVEFQASFWLSSFTLIKRLFCSFSLSAIRVVSSTYLRLLVFLLEISWLQLVIYPTRHFTWCTLHIS